MKYLYDIFKRKIQLLNKTMEDISEFVTKEELFEKLNPTFFKTFGIRKAIAQN